MNKSCPHCGAIEAFQKVSVIVESETSVINTTVSYRSTGVSVGMGGGSGDAVSSSNTSGTTSGVQSTALATRLAPPPPPPVPREALSNSEYLVKDELSTMGCLMVPISMVILIIAPATGITGILFGSIFALLRIWHIDNKYKSPESEKIRQDYKNAQESYAEQFDIWQNHLWFCKRCGNFTNTKETSLLGNGES